MPLAKVRIKPEREGTASIKVTAQPVRLAQNVSGQNRTGVGKKHP